MKKINLILSCIFSLVLFLSFISAVPQVILSSFNLTIYNNTWKINGEGINAVDLISVNGNCTMNYFRQDIPITFTRDFEPNQTDVAVLISALAKNYNISDQWQRCVVEYAQVNKSLTDCLPKAAIADGNYTSLQVSYGSCVTARDQFSKQVSDQNAEVSTLKQTQMFLIVGLVIVAFLAYNFYNKSRVRVIDSPLSQLPSRARM